MQYFYCLIINILDNFSESFLDLLQLAQAIVIVNKFNLSKIVYIMI